MEISVKNKRLLGINSLGRIGKLTLWNQLATRNFDGIVVNVGREVGKTTDDLLQVLETDTTYGQLGKFLHGVAGKPLVSKVVDEANMLFEIDGMPVKVLRSERNPSGIPWRDEGVQLVIDCTGQFLDPVVPPDAPKGSLRGHLVGGARKVIASAPFKIKDKSARMPEDALMMVFGVNHLNYNPSVHHVISAASCTTTGLSHMMKPLLEDAETSKILTASMSTVHSATNTQSVLDAVPKVAASDLRKSRSVFNNIILSTTGAAKALESILPDIQKIGFMADSVRIPTTTVSLITLNITFNSGLDESGNPLINRNYINRIYKNAATGAQKDLLIFSERQNVSADMMGFRAAAVIEGCETHTRTGFVNLPASMFEAYGMKNASDINMPVTHAKIFGWYDNEFGSYVTMLSKLAAFIDSKL